MLNFMVGKWTYVVGVVMILHAIVVTGVVDQDWGQAQTEILVGLGFITGRKAIAKVEAKVNGKGK